jgi:two-component system nitrate/nitrite response regulator NarL
MAPDAPVTIAVCDSSEIGRLGVRTALTRHGLDVVGTASDAESALALLKSSALRVVLVDLDLRPAGRATAVDVIAAAADAGVIPIATASGGPVEQAFAALRAGAAGYLTKDMPSRAWVDAIVACLRGEAPLSRAMTAALIDEFRAQARRFPMSQLLPSEHRLTRREWEILQCIARGQTNRDVADTLCISVETVRTHVSNILAKLDAPNRNAAAAKYRELTAVSGGLA